MPGQIAPAYVAADANKLFTRASPAWFGGHFAASITGDLARTVCARIDPRLRGALGTMRAMCAGVGFAPLIWFSFGEMRCF